MGGGIMQITLDKKTSAFIRKASKKALQGIWTRLQPIPDWLLKKHPEDKVKSFCSCCGSEA